MHHPGKVNAGAPTNAKSQAECRQITLRKAQSNPPEILKDLSNPKPTPQSKSRNPNALAIIDGGMFRVSKKAHILSLATLSPT